MTTHTDVLRGIYAGFATGDIAAVLGPLAPDVQWTEAEGFPYGGTYVGPDAVLENVFMRIGADWSSYSASPAEFLASGDSVVVLGEYRGTHRASGKSFRSPFVHVWRFVGGRVSAFQQHTDTVLVQRAIG
jgi:ketosteroid isomerase-like protein